MVHEKNFQPNQPQNNKNKSQRKGKFDAKNKPSHSTNFKKNSHNGKGYKPQFGSTAQNLYGCIYLLSANLMVLQVFLHL